MSTLHIGTAMTDLRRTAVVLIIAAALEVLAMAHHPSGRAPDILQTLAQLRALANLAAWVHGVLIALLLIGLYGLIEFSSWRGMSQPRVRLALLAYGVGVLAMVGAATISGFVTARVAELTPTVEATDLRVAEQILVLCAILNRAMANLGTIAMSVGIVSWSWDLLRGTRAQVLVGVLGGGVGLFCSIALVAGALRLDVNGMFLVVILQSAWVAAVGLLLFFASHVGSPGAAASFK